MGDHVKGLSKLKVCNVHCSLLVYRTSHLTREGNWVTQAWPALNKRETPLEEEEIFNQAVVSVNKNSARTP